MAPASRKQGRACNLCIFFASFLTFALLRTPQSSCQQQTYAPASYCSNTDPANLGYLCSQASPSCRTYAYFRPAPPLPSLAGVASLFHSNTSAIATASGISDSNPSASLSAVFVPLDCACTSGSSSLQNLSQAAIMYTIQPGDSFSKIALSTFQGLTTCSAIENANPDVRPASLLPGDSTIIPVRCACPSQQLLDQGISLLITYPVVPQDNPSSISAGFGISTSSLLQANNLSQESVIYPQTTLLIPLQEKPQTLPVFPAIASSPQPTPNRPGSPGSSHLGIYIGIPVGVVVLVSAVIAAILWWKPHTADAAQSSEVAMLPNVDTKSSNFSLEIASIDKKPLVYSMEEIMNATEGLNDSNHIKGSVYRGTFGDQQVAVKKIEKDVSKEVAFFQKVHHSNLVPLLGVCIGSQQSFLVSPYMEKGSLNDWLHGMSDYRGHVQSQSCTCLSWCQRLRIATDIADVLEYLHFYTNPAFVHKDIKSSNVLVDAKFRGKLANFGLVMSVEKIKAESVGTEHIAGTLGYMAPEYLKDGVISKKMDVFAFGVVLLEILSGEEAIMKDEEGVQMKDGLLYASIGKVLEDEKMEENLVSWIDGALGEQYPLDCAIKLAQLAKRCVADASARPDMSYVASVLSQILRASESWMKLGANNQLEGR